MKQRATHNKEGRICKKAMADNIAHYIMQHPDYASTPKKWYETLQCLQLPKLKSVVERPAFIFDNTNELITGNQLNDVLNKLYDAYPDIGVFEDVFINVHSKTPSVDDNGNLLIYPLDGFIVNDDLYKAKNAVYIIMIKINNEWFVYKIGMTSRQLSSRISQYGSNGVIDTAVFSSTEKQFINLLYAYHNVPDFDCKFLALNASMCERVNDSDDLFGLKKVEGYTAENVEEKLIRALYKYTGKYPIGCIQERGKL